jgi:hypothetical protein
MINIFPPTHHYIPKYRQLRNPGVNSIPQLRQHVRTVGGGQVNRKNEVDNFQLKKTGKV